MPPEIITWKYFDHAVLPASPRGFAWVRNGEVHGFIGLIPFALRCDGVTQPAAWTCDWSLADPQTGAGMGVQLLKAAISAQDYVFATGGNENTRRLLPRIAKKTIADAGIRLVLPLRMGALLRKAERVFPWLSHRTFSVLARLPIPRARSLGSERMLIEPGVAPVLAGLFDLPRSTRWHPYYNLDHVSWQLGRCPAISSWSLYVPGYTHPPAAALVWRSRESDESWRLALWTDGKSPDALRSVLGAAITHVFEHKGFALSAIVSRLDLTILPELVRKKFIPSRAKQPLFLCSRKSELPMEELSSLSFLDTDLWYRF
jgi:hypothetical protein